MGAARLSIDLAPDLAEEVSAAVRSGEYGSADEVVRDALRDWTAARALRGYDIAEIRRLWDEGLASGPPVEASDVFDRLLDKYRAMSARD